MQACCKSSPAGNLQRLMKQISSPAKTKKRVQIKVKVVLEEEQNTLKDCKGLRKGVKIKE